MDVIVGFVMGALTVLLAVKMNGWNREENKKSESEDISEHGVDKD